MEVPSRSALMAICLNISERLWVASAVKLEECFEKNSLLASLTRSESWLNASVQLGLSALYQGGTSHLLELGGLSRVTFRVVLPRDILSTGSGEGCHLLGLGDCLGTGVGGVAEVGCSSTGEVLYSRAGRDNGGVCPNDLSLQVPHDVAMLPLE